MTPVVETLRAGDQEVRSELARLAFGRGDRFDADRPLPPLDHQVAHYDGDRLVGAATFLDGGQWWGGRSVPMAGLAGVCVAPDHRGQNLARLLVSEALRRGRARGDAISALYPTTATLYRSLGYEIAGWYTVTDIPIADLGRLPADRDLPVSLAPATFADVDTAYTTIAPRHNGWLDPSLRHQSVVRYDFERSTEPRAIYAAHRGGQVVGALAYRELLTTGRLFEISATRLLGVDAATLRGVLGLLGAHGTMGRAVRTYLPENQLALVVPHAQYLQRTYQFPFMVRILDVPGALVARGYAAGLTLEIDLEVHGDAIFGGNNGRFVLRIADGSGTVEQGGRGSSRVHIGELAAAFSGLARLDPALDLAFAGPPPTLVDFF
jgi:predicted acetyltransferase